MDFDIRLLFGCHHRYVNLTASNRPQCREGFEIIFGKNMVGKNMVGKNMVGKNIAGKK
jgi:hypothetical protein